MFRSCQSAQRELSASESSPVEPVSVLSTTPLTVGTISTDRRVLTRERLTSAIVDVVAEREYAHTTVADVLTRSGASRSTFYEHFTDKHSCFSAALGQITTAFSAKLDRAVAKTAPEYAVRAVIETLLSFAEEHPAQAKLLFAETLSAGAQAMEERDRLMARVERLVDERRNEIDDSVPLVDLSSRVIVAGIFRLVLVRLLHPNGSLNGLADALARWMDTYAIPHGPGRWRAISYTPLPKRPPRASLPSMPSARALPRGRHGLTAVELTRVYHERILYATAEVIRERGYTDSTVADIITRANVSRKVFYTHFRDKQQAASEAQELTFHQSMAVAGGAFFSASTWPERVWEATRAFFDFIAAHPNFAHLSVIELHAVIPRTAQYLQDRIVAFTLFLEAGYSYRPQSQNVPRVTSEMLAAISFELSHQELRQEHVERLSQLIPYFTYMYLAPFMGPCDATDFIQHKLADGAR